MKKLRLLFLVILIALIFSSCQSEPTSVAPVIPTPEPDKAVITGHLIHKGTGIAYVDTLVRLAEVYRNDAGDGAFALDQSFSPGAYTDENGYFIFTNLTPGEFVIVLGDPAVDYLIILDDTTQKAKIYQVDAGKTLDIGDLSVDF